MDIQYHKNTVDEKTAIHTMVNPNLKLNATHIQLELEWFSDLLRRRLQREVEKNAKALPLEIHAPILNGTVSVYSQYIHHYNLTAEERVILMLALLPHIQPWLIERILQEFNLDSRQIPEIGGIKGVHHGGMIPTAETALYLLAGNDIEKRLQCTLLFSPKHKFSTCNLLRLGEVTPGEPEWSGMIIIAKDSLTSLTTGTAYHPAFNTSFPAKLISTQYDPEKLVLDPETERGLEEIKLWLKHNDCLLNELGFSNYSNGGYKSLFYGPPGTGKSLAAALLGKIHNLPVYRIDLSMVISKYIGETEKNISNIFDLSKGNKWILFFDEADALFGKRTISQTAQDRFANQEISYLLMRMEEYNGLAILATNFKQNIDRAFLRRFHSVVNFPSPGPEERLKLWKQSFSVKTTHDATVDLEDLAQNFSLTGSNIMNVVKFASLMALKNGNTIIRQSYIMEGIRKELSKEQVMAMDMAG